MSERTARAFWVVAPGRGALRDEPVGEPGPGAVLVRARCSAVSRGTECLVFSGRVPASQREAMRAPWQAGDFPAPVKYGYSSVGVVEAGEPALRGRRVFCLYPHQDLYVVPAEAVVEVPDAVPDERAVLAANMETALNGLWDAAPRPGDRVAIVGAGVLGCLVARLVAPVPGCRVELIDPDPSRAGVAAALGVGFAAPQAALADADLVVHASGAPAGLETALRLAGFEAVVLEMSWFGDRRVDLPLGEAFHSKRLLLRASQVGAVAAARRPRRSRRQRLELALALLADPALDVLLTGESEFSRLPETMAWLAQAPGGVLCHRVVYPG